MRDLGPQRVRITCTGSRSLPINDLEEFQGELKSLSEEAHAKLRKEILLKGVSFPIAVWRQGPNEHVIDGHQRLRTLMRMQKEGFEIPPVPVIDIQAADEREAKEKVLAAASQYGQMQAQGLYEFMHDAGIDFATVNGNFQFPEIELPLFHAEYFAAPPAEDPRGEAEAPPTPEAEHAAEEEPAPEHPVTKLPPGPEPEPQEPRTPAQRPIDVDDKESVTYKFLPEEKQDLMFRLDELMREWKVTSHAEVVFVLVGEAHRKLAKKKPAKGKGKKDAPAEVPPPSE